MPQEPGRDIINIEVKSHYNMEKKYIKEMPRPSLV